MSAVIQKRRVKAKANQLDEKQLSTYEPDNVKYHNHIKNLNAFEANFNKHLADGDLRILKATLNNFYKSFKKNEQLINDLSRHGEGPEQSNDNAFLIKRSSGTIKLLAEYFVNERNHILQSKSTHEFSERLSLESQEVTVLAIKNIKAFIVVNPVFGRLLAHSPMFIETLLRLTLQNYKLYFKQTLRILEALIRYNPETITEDLYPIISDILSNLPKKYFGRFSRILALLLLENTEKPDAQDSVLDYSDNKLNKMHLFMLSRTNLLETYVIILESLTKTIQSLISVNSDNLSKTLHYLKESKLIKDSAADLRILKPVFEQCKSVKNLIAEVFASEFIIKFVVSKSNITEIFYILSSLLAGRRKYDVQNQLNDLNFFKRIIEPFFEILFHPNLELEDPEDISNVNNPLSSARVQFIKILINFCEGSLSNVDSFFISPAEKEILEKEISLEQVSLSSISQLKTLCNLNTMKANMFEKVGNKGLLHKIILLLRRTNANSTYYSWISCFIQTCLKQTSQMRQIFVAHTGLLAHLIDLLARNQINLQSNIQATFDLIGEIFKFNSYNMVLFEKLCKGFGWKTALVKKVEQNFVNSNVFVRSAISSYEKILIGLKTEKESQIEEHLNLFGILFEKKVQYFESLIQAATTQTTNQDNLCCVNTALVIAIIIEQTGSSLELCLGNSLKDSGKLLEVLDMWNRYYLSKTKLRFALELTTSIKFIYFQDIIKKVEFLVEGTGK